LPIKKKRNHKNDVGKGMGEREGTGWKRNRKMEEGPEEGSYQWVSIRVRIEKLILTYSFITSFPSSHLSHFSCLAHPSSIKMEVGGILKTQVSTCQTT
jgi:hypothetical protein